MYKTVLIGCEESGTVREEYRKRGHDAWSCDIQPARDGSPYHIQGCVLKAVYSRKWDQFIVHPDCTYLSVSGQHWNGRIPGRQEKTEAAVKFFMDCVHASEECNIPEFGAENPVCIMSTRWRKPNQIVQPYEFGEDASKFTCFWTRGLPLLIYGLRFPGRWVRSNGKLVERWSNQTDSGQNRLGPNENRKRDRAKTYLGIAEAMAIQWGDHTPCKSW